MKKYLTAVMLLIGLTVAAAASGSPEYVVAAKSGAGSQTTDKAAIAALWKNYARFAMDGNFDAFLELHDRHAYKMPPNRPMFQIWAIADRKRAQWVEAARNNTTVMSVTPKETVIMGNYAYSFGTYYETDTPKAGGVPIITDGKFLTVLRKDPNDGKWKILRDCYNSNVAPK